MKLRLIPLSLLAILTFSSCKDKLTGPPANPASSDTIANWTFNGNTNDVSGNGHNGSITGTTSYGKNRFGQAGSALVLDHQTTVVVPSKSDLNMLTGNSYTISAWVWLNDTMSLNDTGSWLISGSVLSKWPWPPVQYAEETGYLINPTIIYPTSKQYPLSGLTYGAVAVSESNVNSSIGLEPPYSNQNAMGVNQWHMVTLVVAAHQNISIYIDSVLMESAAFEIKDQVANNDFPLTIGPLPDGSLVDDIIMLHSAMGANDVQTRFHEGGWYAG